MAQAMRTMERRSRRRQIGGGLLAAFLLLVAASDVAGQQPKCAPREALVRAFASQVGEIPVASGLMSDGTLLEVLTSPSGTWTIIATQPGGIACLVTAGDGWIQAPVPLPGRDS